MHKFYKQNLYRALKFMNMLIIKNQALTGYDGLVPQGRVFKFGCSVLNSVDRFFRLQI